MPSPSSVASAPRHQWRRGPRRWRIGAQRLLTPTSGELAMPLFTTLREAISPLPSQRTAQSCIMGLEAASKEKPLMNRVGKFAAALVPVSVIAMASFASFAASEFEGTWAVKEYQWESRSRSRSLPTAGRNQPCRKPTTGTWIEEGGAAVISWESGWIDQDRQRGRQVREDGLQERRGPRRSADQHVRRG